MTAKTKAQAEQAAIVPAPAEQAPTGALALIAEAASNPDVDPDKLRALLAVKRDWEADEARKAYAGAMAQFQGTAPIVDKGDTANGRAYSRIDRIWKAVRPLMQECGLTVSWQECLVDGDLMRLRGQLQHRDGHAQAIAFDLPMPDQIKGQNASQRMGSATTYAKRYCICAALNIVTGDEDNDGEGVGVGEPVTHDQAIELEELLQDAGLTRERLVKFWRWAECEAMDGMPAAKLADARKMLKVAIAAREKAHADAEAGELP